MNVALFFPRLPIIGLGVLEQQLSEPIKHVVGYVPEACEVSDLEKLGKW